MWSFYTGNQDFEPLSLARPSKNQSITYMSTERDSPFFQLTIKETEQGEYKILLHTHASDDTFNQKRFYRKMDKAGLFSYPGFSLQCFKIFIPFTTTDPALLATFFRLVKKFDPSLSEIESKIMDPSVLSSKPAVMPKWFLQEYYKFESDIQTDMIYAIHNKKSLLIRIGVSTRPLDEVGSLDFPTRSETTHSVLGGDFNLCFQFHHRPLVGGIYKRSNRLFGSDYKSIKRTYYDELAAYDREHPSATTDETQQIINKLRDKIAITQRYFPAVIEISDKLLQRTEEWMVRYQLEKAQGLHTPSSQDPGCTIM